MSFMPQSSSEQIYLQNLISTLYAFSHCQQTMNEKMNYQQPKSNSFQQSIISQIPQNQSPEFFNKNNFRLDEPKFKTAIDIDNKQLGVSEKVDEHFRRSLGKQYYRIFDDTNNKIVKNKKNKNKLPKKIKKILNKSKNFINQELVNNILESKDNDEISSNTCNKSSVYSNEDICNSTMSQIDPSETFQSDNDSNCLSVSESNKSIDNYEKLSLSKEEYKNFDGYISSNECVVDADETQSLILSTTSSVTDEHLSINTDTFYDEDEEYIDNVEENDDHDEATNLINNLNNNEENSEKV